ncbi:transmembrane 4 L6 family member 18 isoform X2 [Macaca fascicularis]|uniref:transmembrane 4 L6 family member 18 isoform X2 n=1 Tax=Macaca fascicularis TaxID=9541 RepID=UPI001E2551BE|nr:transmembrane 4 L6 family member 18 isoform X2 [Macaca fascicularis]
MGSRKCGGCLSCLLIPLALWSIIVNILLYFPNGQTSYASSNKLTNYVWYFEGICFSGVMTLLSIIFSSLGIAFSGYCLVISALGLIQGPYCRTLDGWEYAFEGTAGRFQHMDSVPGTCTCCGVEHHFIFHSHNPQWASSDHLPHQSSHAIIQDTVWKLFSDHPVTLLNTASITGALGLNTSAISPFVSSMDTVNNGLSTPALCQSQGVGWGDTEENIFLLDACCANSRL